MTNVGDAMNRAVQCYRAGRVQTAQQLCRDILADGADHPDALHLLGVIACKTGRYDEAIELISRAIAQDRRVPQFHNTLGVVLRTMGKLEEALAAYEQALLLDGGYAEAHHNIGNVFFWQRRYAAAVEKYNLVISLDPQRIEAYNSSAIALQYLGEYDAAIERCRQVLLQKPEYAEACNTLASILVKKGLYVEAIENYRRALQLKADYAEAHCNLGMALLSSGRFEEGWAEYAWRLKTDRAAYLRGHPAPCWDGSCFAGKRLLVRHEQGFGDNIQFMRYLPMVKRLGGKVCCEVLGPLAGLFAGFPGVDEAVEVSPGMAPAGQFDFHVPLLEIPRILGTTLETIPATVPYVFANPARAQHWRARFSRTDLNVGIVWAGHPAHREDAARSCPLRAFLRLSRIPHVRLFGLQKGGAAAQAKDLAADMPLLNLGDELDDFTDTAAVIENLDLVISVDTAVLHLAGAMAKPAWALLPSSPDWRWMLDRSDTPWYPTVKLFRQQQHGCWDDVFHRVSEELTARAAGRESAARPLSALLGAGLRTGCGWPID